MKITSVLFAAFIISVHCCAHAASTQQQVQLTHSEFNQPLVFNVFLPSSYQQKPDKDYILLFDFHPYSHTYLSGMHDWLSHNSEWPWLETIIVTPAYGNNVGKLFDSTGKTTPLLDFFEQQLFPQIDKKYRTSGFRIMSGFRTNASLVLSALYNKPNLANAYIATSPELSKHSSQLLSSAKASLTKLDDKPRFLFLSHGTNVKEAHQMHAYTELHSALKQHANDKLDWHYRHFEQHYFMSLPLVSVITAIELLFNDIHQGIAPTSAIAQKGVDSIVKYYQYLSTDKYGFEVSPKHSIEKLGTHQLNKDQIQGIATLKHLITLFPDDSYSYHNVASGYAKIGEINQAISFQKKAVALSKNRQSWHQKDHQKALQRYVSLNNN